MAKHSSNEMIQRFRDHVDELAETSYEGQYLGAFRHAAFQQTADPTLSDQQVIELTAIDRPGDLEIDGYFDNEGAEEFFLFQSAGGTNKVDEGKLTKFWLALEEILSPERVEQTTNESVRELSTNLEEKLKEGYSLRMVFASNGGFSKSARAFADTRERTDRVVSLRDGTRHTVNCILQLHDEESLAKRFDDHQAGLQGESNEVTFTLAENMSYASAKNDLRFLRATISAKELIEEFRKPGIGFRLFSLNPRGPIANAQPNKDIAKTVSSERGRRIFHLLNNGICATCDNFQTKAGTLTIKGFQIVNGCQTTVTLNDCKDFELEETWIDLKLTIAGDEENLAQEIASASNSQSALKAKDYTSFEKQQRRLQSDFGSLQPPWYYEIKQGYWRFVLTDKEKARYKTGRRKRHIGVQPLAQAALAFIGHPDYALDRVRFVFQGMRPEQDRQWYDRAFPSGVKPQQLLLPWILLDLIQKKEREKYSTFHLIWLISFILKEHYQLEHSGYFSSERCSRLIETRDSWFPDVFRVVNTACRNSIRRANSILKSDTSMQLRDFFRASKELAPGVIPLELLREATSDELEIAKDNDRDPRQALP